MISPWHYPRDRFTSSVFELLIGGPKRAISLFGRRRIGKTQFLVHDLRPYAAALGHRVVYASLWQSGTDPLAILLYRCAAVLNDAPKVKSASFNLNVGVASGKVEFDPSRLGQLPHKDALAILEEVLQRLSDSERPTFLLLDEFQALAGANLDQGIIPLLKNAFEQLHGLVWVFTGSSQRDLDALFKAKQAPFYRFSAEKTLPPLDDAFVSHQLKIFADRRSRRPVDPDKALEAFNSLARNAQLFQDWLEVLADDPSVDETFAVQRVKDHWSRSLDFEAHWDRLKPLHRAVARFLCDRSDGATGRAGADHVEMLTGIQVSETQLRAAVRLLERHELVGHWQGERKLADPLLELWIKDRPEDDFSRP